MDKNVLKESMSFDTKDLALMGLLIALEIVFSRFLSIALWNIKIGFAFIPVVYAAMKLGPMKAGIVGALADFVGATLFPIGTYFPGFTFTAFLVGATYGLFLYRDQSMPKIITAVLINQLVFSLLLNSLWISILYGSPYFPLLLTRIVQTAIIIPVQILVIKVLADRARILIAA